MTIQVVPFDSGDFRGEFRREIDIRLVPQGIILPTNPNLVATFTFTPAAPQVLQTVSFDASTTTNNGTACVSCVHLYVEFRRRHQRARGKTTTHQFRTVNNFNVTLTVTDARGATAISDQGGPGRRRHAADRRLHDFADAPRA